MSIINSMETEDIALNKAYHGIRLIFVARLDSIRQTMKIDIGFGDIIIPAAQSLSYPVLIRDLPVPDILAYSLETVVAEKFHAMIDLAESNSRMKDFYDVYILLKNNEIDNVNLQEAILQTFKRRNTIFTENHPLFSEDFVKDPSRIFRWKHFLKKINAPDWEFPHIVKNILERLQPIYKAMKVE